jgi:flagellar biosynthesis/type III secretory pathway protein FliH
VLSKKYNIAMTAELESEVQRMCNLSTAIENQGIKKGLAEGLAEGRAEGRVEGVDLMAKLVKILLAEKKYSDVEKASDDAEYRDKLLKEYKLVG